MHRYALSRPRWPARFPSAPPRRPLSTLVGTRGGLLLRQSDGGVRVLEAHSGVRLPSLPGGLISRPTLAWDIEAT